MVAADDTGYDLQVFYARDPYRTPTEALGDLPDHSPTHPVFMRSDAACKPRVPPIVNERRRTVTTESRRHGSK